MCNMLIIGNGFDKALHIPTGYGDFLTFQRNAQATFDNFGGYNILKDSMQIKYRDVYASVLEDNPSLLQNDLFWSGLDACRRAVFNGYERMQLQLLGVSEISDSDFGDKIFYGRGFREINAKLIWLLIHKNFWLEYFKQIDTIQGWGDFEEAIGKLLIDLTNENYTPDIIDTFQCFGFHPSDEKVSEFLEEQLIGLKDFIEVYLLIFERIRQMVKEKQEIISGKAVSEDKNINKLDKLLGKDIEYVVSLNYANTYNSVFHGTGNVERIHGQIRDIENGEEDFSVNANLVAGIDERKPLQRYGWAFKKQQIRQYNVSMKYLDWLRNNASRVNKIIIYGCSLRVVDRDVFAPVFMKFPDIEKNIYYYGDETARQKVQDAVRNLMDDSLFYKKQLLNGKISFLVANDC